ncbi:hypothetical protein B0J17DRAFT_718503 [Rhizoctonia solani]|nr:hypothetical protein B0J17DRAFT_718503 [Rhizoctonia solani]
MDTPSTPNRPRHSTHGPPRRESTTSRRVTRSRAAFQNAQPPSSSLSPAPPEPEPEPEPELHEQGGATHLTVPAESHDIQLTAAQLDGEQAPILNASTSGTPNKRKTPAKDEDDGPLLSEYMCPICFSPPAGAIVTLCGHIMCGSCLYGAITARGAPPQKLCPVCRTPIQNLQFTRPAPIIPERQPTPPRRPLEPRTIHGGVRLPTAGEDMVDPNEQEVIDVDVDMEEVPRPEPRWDPARSGVIGLEVLTLGVDEFM